MWGLLDTWHHPRIIIALGSSVAKLVPVAIVVVYLEAFVTVLESSLSAGSGSDDSEKWKLWTFEISSPHEVDGRKSSMSVQLASFESRTSMAASRVDFGTERQSPMSFGP